MPKLNKPLFAYLLSFCLIFCSLNSQQTSIQFCLYSKLDTSTIQRCTVCINGYQLNLNYTRCSKCVEYNQNCQRCDLDLNRKVYCQACVIGYYLSNGTCLRMNNCSDLHCIECTFGSNECFYCRRGYQLINNSCIKCSVEGQIYIKQQAKCGCMDTFYLASIEGSFICRQCTYPCNSCKEVSTNCITCIIGFFFKDFSCLPCGIANCIICSSLFNCTNCTLGYALVDQSCQIQLQQQNYDQYVNLPEFYYFCQPGCFYCYKYDFCVSCLEGFDRNVYSDDCQKCSEGCRKCNSLQNLTCVTCFQGFLLVQGTCQRCPSNCITCSSLNLLCHQCQPGFTQVSGQCLSCAQNCISCSTAGNGTCDIGGCKDGFVRVSNTQCIKCALGCFSCSAVDITTCISCPVGSFQIVGGQCQVCDLSCVACQSVDLCTICRAGYRLIGQKCFEDCVYPCLNCSAFNRNICSTCFDGYKLSEDMTCVNDISCNQYFNCTICPLSYYLNLTTLTCSSCNLQTHCLKCETEKDKCAICEVGFYLLQNECLPCNSSCLTCQLEQYCFSCRPNHFLFKKNFHQVYGQCLPCSSVCLTCIMSSTQCNSCKIGYKLIGFSCISASNIILQITLQNSYTQNSNGQQIAFIKEIVGFVFTLAQYFGQPYSSNPSLIYLQGIESGSIVATFLVMIENIDPRLVHARVLKSLTNLTQYNNFAILETKIVTDGFKDDSLIQPPLYYLILSLIPAPALILSFLMIAFRFFQDKRAQFQQIKGQAQKPQQCLQIKLETLQTLQTQKNIISSTNETPVTL